MKKLGNPNDIVQVFSIPNDGDLLRRAIRLDRSVRFYPIRPWNSSTTIAKEECTRSKSATKLITNEPMLFGHISQDALLISNSESLPKFGEQPSLGGPEPRV